jgi:hypothetical protein
MLVDLWDLQRELVYDFSQRHYHGILPHYFDFNIEIPQTLTTNIL